MGGGSEGAAKQQMTMTGRLCGFVDAPLSTLFTTRHDPPPPLTPTHTNTLEHANRLRPTDPNLLTTHKPPPHPHTIHPRKHATTYKPPLNSHPHQHTRTCKQACGRRHPRPAPRGAQEPRAGHGLPGDQRCEARRVYMYICLYVCVFYVCMYVYIGTNGKCVLCG